jgi:hypothetical protein
MKDARGHGSAAHGTGIEQAVPSKHWGYFMPDGPRGRMVYVPPKVKTYSGPHQSVDQIYRQSMGR